MSIAPQSLECWRKANIGTCLLHVVHSVNGLSGLSDTGAFSADNDSFIGRI